MNFFRTLAVSCVLVVLVFLTTAVLFRSGNDRPSTDSRIAVPLVQATADLHLEYFEPMKAAVSRSDVDCRNSPLKTSHHSSCEALVDNAARLDPIVVDVITRLEMSDQQLGPGADDALVRGIQRNLELATSAHEFNVSLTAAWTESDQSKWNAAWDIWQSLTTQLGAPEPVSSPRQ